jgi:hypothetical protein
MVCYENKERAERSHGSNIARVEARIVLLKPENVH